MTALITALVLLVFSQLCILKSDTEFYCKAPDLFGVIPTEAGGGYVKGGDECGKEQEIKIQFRARNEKSTFVSLISDKNHPQQSDNKRQYALKRHQEQ